MYYYNNFVISLDRTHTYLHISQRTMPLFFFRIDGKFFLILNFCEQKYSYANLNKNIRFSVPLKLKKYETLHSSKSFFYNLLTAHGAISASKVIKVKIFVHPVTPVDTATISICVYWILFLIHSFLKVTPVYIQLKGYINIGITIKFLLYV